MSYLRDNGIITEKQYVGKTMDVKSNRINFRIKGGYITAAYGG